VRRAKTHFELTPAEYERSRRGHLERRRRDIVQRALRQVPEGGRVLELGSGTGSLLAELAARRPDVEFLGVDVEPKMVAYAEAHHAPPNVRFESADPAEASLGAGGTHDLAVSIDVLHHVTQLEPFVSAIARLLRPTGSWLAIEPNIWHPYVFLSQERMRRAGLGEDHFRPWRAERVFRGAALVVAEKRYALFFPGWLDRVPRRLARIEPPLERFRFLGGSVVYRLERREL
jgi:2-polyprenyl-3-methyl-5-hydroxy-6-metoxy-1,4-benzoquinol methylase